MRVCLILFIFFPETCFNLSDSKYHLWVFVMFLLVKFNEKQCGGKIKIIRKGETYKCSWSLNYDQKLEYDFKLNVYGVKNSLHVLIFSSFKVNNDNSVFLPKFKVASLDTFNYEFSIQDFPSYLNGIELILNISYKKYNHSENQNVQITLNRFIVGKYFFKN